MNTKAQLMITGSDKMDMNPIQNLPTMSPAHPLTLCQKLKAGCQNNFALEPGAIKKIFLGKPPFQKTAPQSLCDDLKSIADSISFELIKSLSYFPAWKPKSNSERLRRQIETNRAIQWPVPRPGVEDFALKGGPVPSFLFYAGLFGGALAALAGPVGAFLANDPGNGLVNGTFLGFFAGAATATVMAGWHR